jgi:hypothetical protein
MSNAQKNIKRNTLTLKHKILPTLTLTKTKAKKKKKINPYYPTSYNEFKLGCKYFKVDPRIITCLNRFIYRYRLGKIFKEITVVDEKFMDKTIHGYSTANKLFLTHTAFQAVEEAANLLRISAKRYDSLELKATLATRIRKNIKLKELIYVEKSKTDVRKSLDKFYSAIAPSNDALQVAYMIRNCFAHGSFTAVGSGLDKQSYMDDINALSEELLIHCDELFTYCFEECKLLSN